MADTPSGFWRLADMYDCSGHALTITRAPYTGCCDTTHGQLGYNAAGGYVAQTSSGISANANYYTGFYLHNTASAWATATFASSFSLEMWVQLPALSTFLTSPSTFNYPRLFEFGNYGGGTSFSGIISLLLYYSSGSLYLLMGSTSSAGSFSYSASPISQYVYTCQANFTSYMTVWTHVVAVNDAAGGTMALYLNGAKVSTDASCASGAIGSVARAYLVGLGSVYQSAKSATAATGFNAATQGGYFSELVSAGPLRAPVLTFVFLGQPFNRSPPTECLSVVVALNALFSSSRSVAYARAKHNIVHLLCRRPSIQALSPPPKWPSITTQVRFAQDI